MRHSVETVSNGTYNKRSSAKWNCAEKWSDSSSSFPDSLQRGLQIKATALALQVPLNVDNIAPDLVTVGIVNVLYYRRVTKSGNQDLKIQIPILRL